MRGPADRAKWLQDLWIKYVGDKDTGRVGSIARFYEKRWKQRFPNRIDTGEDLVREFR